MISAHSGYGILLWYLPIVATTYSWYLPIVATALPRYLPIVATTLIVICAPSGYGILPWYLPIVATIIVCLPKVATAIFRDDCPKRLRQFAVMIAQSGYNTFGNIFVEGTCPPSLKISGWISVSVGSPPRGLNKPHQGSRLIRKTPLFAYPSRARSKWLGMSLGGTISHRGASGAFQRRPLIMPNSELISEVSPLKVAATI